MSGPSIQIFSEDGKSTGTKIVALSDDRKFNGVSSVKVDIIPGKPIVAEITMVMIQIDLEALGRFIVVDPVSLEQKEISKIIYADGTEFVPPSAVTGE